MRVELHKQIMDWYDNPNRKCILWLTRMARTGKSTISCIIARELAEKKQLAVSFFFTRGKKDVSHAGMFFTMIAAQLATISAKNNWRQDALLVSLDASGLLGVFRAS